MKKKLLLACCCFLFSFGLLSAQPAFFKEVQKFKALDSIHAPLQHAILFIGSSSFTKWVDVQDYFPNHPIVNRAFGGSTLPDVIRYANDIIFRYQPRQVIIYCGENDIASSDSISAQIVFNRFKHLFQMIRARLPKAAIAYVSMKPSPSREKFWPKMVEGNSLIKKFLGSKKHTAFIDVYSKMFNEDGSVMKDIFIEDNLHMNAKGYAIWQKVMEPYLLPLTTPTIQR